MIPFGYEQPQRSEEKGPFVFRLYVVDEGPGSARAIANLSAICKNHLPDNHQIEIVDLLQDPRRVLSDHVPGDSDVDQAVARSRSEDHRRPGPGSKSVACFGAAATDHVRQSDETGIGNIGKLCGSHSLGSGGGKRFVYKQHGSERLCQGDDPSRCPRVHRRSVQLSGDGFDVYGHAGWNLVVAWRAGRRLFVCRQSQ